MTVFNNKNQADRFKLLHIKTYYDTLNIKIKF